MTVMQKYNIATNKGFIDLVDSGSMFSDTYRSLNKSIKPKNNELAGFLKVLNCTFHKYILVSG